MDKRGRLANFYEYESSPLEIKKGENQKVTLLSFWGEKCELSSSNYQETRLLTHFFISSTNKISIFGGLLTELTKTYPGRCTSRPPRLNVSFFALFLGHPPFGHPLGHPWAATHQMTGFCCSFRWKRPWKECRPWIRQMNFWNEWTIGSSLFKGHSWPCKLIKCSIT